MRAARWLAGVGLAAAMTGAGLAAAVPPVLATPAPTSGYAAAVLADAPSVYLRLGDGAGATTATDSSASADQGSYTASGTPGSPGALPGDPDTAVTGDGTGPVVTAPDTPLPTGTSPRTVEIWEKTTVGAEQGLFTWGGPFSPHAFELTISSSGSTSTLTGYENGFAPINSWSTALPVADGAWHQIVVTYDGGTTWGVYLDGTFLGNQGSDVLGTGSDGYGDHAHLLWVGAAYHGQPFAGSLDEFAVYPSVLSGSRIAAHLLASGQVPQAPQTVQAVKGDRAGRLSVTWSPSPTAGGFPAATGYQLTARSGATVISRTEVPASACTGATCTASVDGLSGGGAVAVDVEGLDPFGAGPAGTAPAVTPPAEGESYRGVVLSDGPSIYYRLDGASSGQGVTDSSGNGHDATPGAGIVFGRAGALPGDTDGAAGGTGAGSVATEPGGAGLPLGDSPRTVEVWEQTVSTAGQALVTWGGPYGGNAYQFGMAPGGTALQVATTGGTNGLAVWNAGSSLADGRWHHLVVAYQGNDVFQAWVDGADLGLASAPLGNAGTINTVPSALDVGDNGGMGGTGLGAFTGTLDELSIYPAALSTSQVDAHYTAGTAPPPPLDPTAAFTQSTVATTVPFRASFDGSTSSPAAADSHITEYDWTWGDGSTAVTTTPAAYHDYHSAGQFTPGLVVVDSGGGRSPAVTGQTITATDPATPYGSTEASDSTVQAQPGDVPADGTSATTITVTLSDGGAILAGHGVTVHPDSANAQLLGPATTVTDAAGQASFRATDATVESVDFVVSDDTTGTTLEVGPGVNFTQPVVGTEASHSTVLVASPSTTANGISTDQVSVTLFDRNNYSIPGDRVTLAASGSAVVTPPSATSDGTGTATFSVTDTQVEQVQLTATDQTTGTTITQTGSVDFQAATDTATLAADVTSGPVPLSVHLDASGSSYPAGSHFYFNCGDGTFGAADPADPTRAVCTYQNPSPPGGYGAVVNLVGPGGDPHPSPQVNITTTAPPPYPADGAGFGTTPDQQVAAAADGSIDTAGLPAGQTCPGAAPDSACVTDDGATLHILAPPGTLPPNGQIQVYHGDPAQLQYALSAGVQALGSFAITWTPRVNLARPLVVFLTASGAPAPAVRSAATPGTPKLRAAGLAVPDFGSFISGFIAGTVNLVTTAGQAVVSAAEQAGSGLMSWYQDLRQPNGSSVNNVILCPSVTRTGNSYQCNGPATEIQDVPTDRIQSLTDGAGVIAAGGANVIAAGGANVIAAGGANVIAAGGANVIAAGGANVIAAGGANVIAAGGANVIAAGGANMTMALQQDPGLAFVAPAQPAPPTVTAGATPGTVSAGTVTVHLAATGAAGTAVTALQYSLSGADNAGYAKVAGAAADIPISTPGTTTVTFSAVDADLNQSAPQTISVTVLGGGGGTVAPGPTTVPTPTTVPPPTPPTVPAPAHGYTVTDSTGRQYVFGPGATPATQAAPSSGRVVGSAPTPDGQGHWLVAADGGVFAFGDAGFFGSLGGLRLVSPVVAMVATPDGRGYWLVAADGGVFAFGDAGFSGSAAGRPLNRPVVGLAITADGRGYWLVAADGGVFAFGDAGYFGSLGGLKLAAPVTAIIGSGDGRGYWLVGADGGVFSLGDARFLGSAFARTAGPVIGGYADPGGA